MLSCYHCHNSLIFLEEHVSIYSMKQHGSFCNLLLFFFEEMRKLNNTRMSSKLKKEIKHNNKGVFSSTCVYLFIYLLSPKIILMTFLSRTFPFERFA